MLREGHGLWVFDNRVSRRIFGLKRDYVIGGWRKLHNKDFPNLYYSWYIIRMMKLKMRLTAYVVCMRKKGRECTILVGRSEGKNQ
jgi:hypothetical protein